MRITEVRIQKAVTIWNFTCGSKFFLSMYTYDQQHARYALCRANWHFPALRLLNLRSGGEGTRGVRREKEGKRGETALICEIQKNT